MHNAVKGFLYVFRYVYSNLHAFSLPPQADSPPKGMCLVHTARFNSSIHHGKTTQGVNLKKTMSEEVPQKCGNMKNV